MKRGHPSQLNRPRTDQSTHRSQHAHLAGNCHSNNLLIYLIAREGLARQLNLKRRYAKLDIWGVGGKKTAQTKGVVSLTLTSRYRSISITIQAHVLSTVTTILPTGQLTHQPEWPHLKGLNLADPDFLIPRPVDVIIGADAYGQLIKPNIIRYSSSAPIAQLSIFGWLVIGPGDSPMTAVRTTHHGISRLSDSPLQDLLTRFWIQEETPTSTDSHLSPEEQECEEHFASSHSRDGSGRYIVKLPLKSSPPVLGDSYRTAHQCQGHSVW
ncbi:uncharacterized protein LOC124404735 [Diprion similis]|uniref:uncharacterized protein LOC124404732 n=1 Tax=Diprion similis TaxID=362088 RepID=UPI001EF811D2|nr:uncharacterized protein LOC124404732 [Diprion similis]XP_046735025.1 uncharacterized protein LOC124404735 [Diprion similis]